MKEEEWENGRKEMNSRRDWEAHLVQVLSGGMEGEKEGW